ncbi:MAG: V-type ATPase subunit [Lentisphaerae bacterium]|nr:V-type ATPase subunit [Lentisphaerota bacterium]
MSAAAYTAACVRACALRAAFLGPGDWRTAAGLAGADDVVAWLKARGLIGDGVADVLAAERAAHASLIRHASGLLRLVRGPAAALLRYFVWYYDLLNLEGAALRIHGFPDAQARPPARFYDTGRFGLLRPAALDAVTQYPALGRVLRHTPFAGPFQEALAGYRDDEEVGRLVERLERAFLADWIAAAGCCGIRPADARRGSPLAVFFVARAVEAAARLMRHRAAERGRAVRWLTLAVPDPAAQRCLDRLSGARPAESLAAALGEVLPGAPERVDTAGSRSAWALLDRLVLQAAEKATRGIFFNMDFLTGILLREMYQARELTVLLEAKATGEPVPVPGEDARP